MTGQPDERGASAEQAPRERLLDAVIEHITAEGLGDQSLRRIAEAVGSSHRMLLYHFGSRDGLLLAVAREVEARTQVAVSALSHATAGSRPSDDAAATGSSEGPSDGARDRPPGGAWATDDMIRQVWDHLSDPALAPFERLFFALYGRALQGDPALRPLIDGDVTRWLDLNVSLAAEAGIDLAPETVRVHARLGLAVVRGLLLDLLATDERAEVGAALELFADLSVARLESHRPAETAQTGGVTGASERAS